jgi:hypothetical protein
MLYAFRGHSAKGYVIVRKLTEGISCNVQQGILEAIWYLRGLQRKSRLWAERSSKHTIQEDIEGQRTPYRPGKKRTGIHGQFANHI